MMRSIPVEWSLFGVGPWNYTTNSAFIYDFWVNGTIRAKPYESIFTMGMRGDGDCEILVNTSCVVSEFPLSAVVRGNKHRSSGENSLRPAADLDERLQHVRCNDHSAGLGFMYVLSYANICHRHLRFL